MGLDMYLHRKLHLNRWEKKEKFPDLKDCGVINNEQISAITETFYWRKMNAIHNWFVVNVQYGVDDCHEYEVNIEQLKRLLEDIKAVLNDRNLASKLLPTQPGFFFGPTDYNEYYFDELYRTKVMLEEIIANDNINTSYFYRSSW